MLTGKPPFLDVSYSELSESAMMSMMQRIKAGSYSRDTPEWQCISDDAKKLVQGIESPYSAFFWLSSFLSIYLFFGFCLTISVLFELTLGPLFLPTRI